MNFFYAAILLFVNTTFAQKTFFEFAKEGNVRAINQILSNDSFDVNSVNEGGYSALMLAAYYNKLDAVEALLNQGADIDQSSKYGTALMAACIKGNTNIVALLIDRGANVNAKDSYGNSALIHAATYNTTAIARLLMQAGADPNVKDYRGNKPLDYAILKQNIEMIKLLNSH